MLALRAAALDGPASERFDLGAVLQDLVGRRALLALAVERRFYDIGNDASIAATEQFVRSQLAR